MPEASFINSGFGLSDKEYSIVRWSFDLLRKSDHRMIQLDYIILYLCYTVVEEPHYTIYLYALGNYQNIVTESLVS